MVPCYLTRHHELHPHRHELKRMAKRTPPGRPQGSHPLIRSTPAPTMTASLIAQSRTARCAVVGPQIDRGDQLPVLSMYAHRLEEVGENARSLDTPLYLHRLQAQVVPAKCLL